MNDIRQRIVRDLPEDQNDDNYLPKVRLVCFNLSFNLITFFSFSFQLL